MSVRPAHRRPRSRVLAAAAKLALLAAMVLLLPGASAVAGGFATPESLGYRLDAAKGGECIRLAPGDYGRLKFPKRNYEPAIRIDAAQAGFAAIELQQVSGVEIKGGRVHGPGGRSYGIRVSKSARIRIEGMRISGAHRGIVVGGSTDVVLVGNVLTGLISDGIDIALASRVRVERNVCRDFNPTPAVFDAAGKRVKDGDHADCIQAWSRPHAPPTSDLTIVGNDIEGRMQGIFLGNHVRNGVDDGGFDRIVIRDNRVKVGSGNGIVLSDGRDSVVTGNSVESVPGTVFRSRPGVPVKANVRVSGERNRVCGNRVADVPDSAAARSCGGPVN